DEQREKEKARILEERRAERRARIMNSASPGSSSTQAQIPSQEDRASREETQTLTSQTWAPSLQTQPSSQMELKSPQQKWASASQPWIRPSLPETRPPPTEIQMSVPQSWIAPSQTRISPANQTSHPSHGVSNLIEEERERIRNEEIRRLKEERQRAEEELLRKEREERLQLQREEEAIQRERQLLLQQQQQQQQLQKQQQHQQQQQLYQQQKHPQVSNEPNYQTNTYNNQTKSNKAISSGHDQNTFQPILSQQDQRQAAGYNAHQRNENQKHPGVLHPQSTHTGAHLDQTRNVRPSSVISAVSQERAHSQNSEPHPQSQSQQGSYHQRSNSSGLPTRSFNVSSIQTASRNDPDLSRNNVNSSRTDLRLSREEMLVMNRTAKPMSAIPTDARDSNNQGQSSAGPITREAPTREEIHSLNSVPKAKLRRDTDWQSTESLNSPKTPNSISPLQPENNSNKSSWQQGREEKPGSKFSLFTSGDHWLVQEAERRRIAESESKLQPRRASNQRPSSSGPIKPAGDTANRWRDQGGFANDQNHATERLKPLSSMPAVIRQTLLQKTAGVRSSNDPVQTFPQAPSPSPSLSYHNSYHNQPSSQAPEQPPQQKRQQWQYNQQPESPHHPPQQVAPGGPALPPQRQHEIKMSGSQLCSHCEQELGYGAAMVIESLGLFFHVQCFRCWVCHASLGTGDQGADVRVRVNKLHCPNCYSNDE
ncbi:unnamed protein product, partial [Candidula unifasciata]